MSDRFVLVLAGGRGERFWPWSRPDRPKQLLPLAGGGRTLLSATVERALALVPASNVVILTARDLKEAVMRDCGSTGVRVLAEPVPRNTAAAVGAAAALFGSQANDPAFAVFPADHAIDRLGDFTEDLERAFSISEREPVLITFGIRPGRPETNFGYIRRGDRVADRVHRVAEFTEKPDRANAAQWIESGGYSWNSGIFVWRCSTFLAGLAAGRPPLAEPLSRLAWRGSDEAFERDLEPVFPELESISVDYAVLEVAKNTLVIEASFDWDDLGSWGAWARRQPRDARGNVLFGEALALDCEGCIVVGDGGTAAAMSLRNMVVVHAGGATLSCKLEDTDQVRRVVEALKTRTRK